MKLSGVTRPGGKNRDPALPQRPGGYNQRGYSSMPRGRHALVFSHAAKGSNNTGSFFDQDI